jgi:flagellar hook-associated protein 2
MAVPLFNIGGLASGLDSNAIIKSILDVERIPINQLETRKYTHQLEDNAWSAINTRYSAIRSALNDLDSAAEFKKLSLATSSNENAVGVSVTGSPSAGTTSFTVDQLATNHQLASNTDFAASDALVGAGDFTITLGGGDHTITATADTTLSQLAAEINSLDIGVSASVISVDGTKYKLILASDETGDANTFTTSGSITSLGTMDILQQGVNAEISIGSGVSALTLSRSSNTITDVIPGVTVDLKATTATAVSVTTKRDLDGAVDAISTLMDAINSTLGTLSAATKYSPDSDTAGPLVGNGTARSLAIDLRAAISSTVKSGATYPVAASVGIALNRDGTFDVDESKLRDALAADFDAVVDLLVAGGESTDSRVNFVAAGTSTVEGSYEVVVTQAAAKANATSAAYVAPGADSTFQILVGSLTADVDITTGMTVTQAVSAINTALQNAGITNVSVTETNVMGSDYIELNHSSYGSGASFEVIGDPFGLAGTYSGVDVAGTIGGQPATGSGRSLTATAGDPEGLIVQVTASPGDVSGAGGSLSLGNLTYARGVFGTLDLTIGYAEGSGGRISRAQDLTASQIDLIDDRIEILEGRLDRREALLLKQYAALETALSSLQTQSSWLSAQLSALSSGGEK